MFEKFRTPKTPEQIEQSLGVIAGKELEIGVNGPSMFHAFNAVRKENEEKNYGLTNNYLLNVVKDCALGQANEIENSLMGGREQVEANINAEIDRLRRDLPEEERGR
jgi:hypothetical protein